MLGLAPQGGRRIDARNSALSQSAAANFPTVCPLLRHHAGGQRPHQPRCMCCCRCWQQAPGGCSPARPAAHCGQADRGPAVQEDRERCAHRDQPVSAGASLRPVETQPLAAPSRALRTSTGLWAFRCGQAAADLLAKSRNCGLRLCAAAALVCGCRRPRRARTATRLAARASTTTISSSSAAAWAATAPPCTRWNA